MEAIPSQAKQTFKSMYQGILEEGMEKGIEKGMEKNKTTATINLIHKGVDTQFICDVLDVDNQFVESIRKKLKA
jgi:predicted transposase YdaD